MSLNSSIELVAINEFVSWVKFGLKVCSVYFFHFVILILIYLTFRVIKQMVCLSSKISWKHSRCQNYRRRALAVGIAVCGTGVSLSSN